MKQTKQFMQQLLLVLVGLVSTTSIKAADYDFKAANSDGVTIYYKVNGENASVVAGDEKYSGTVTIPEKVTNEGKEYAVTTIGFRAFYECTMLTNVHIPNSVTIVEGYAFGNDVQLSSIEFPNSIEKLGGGVCCDCTNLSSVHLPSSIKEIPEYAFNETALKTIEIPYGVQIIKEHAFSRCLIEKVTIPNSVVVIGQQAFQSNKNLKEIIIPSSVKSIGNLAFNFPTAVIEKVTVMNKQPFEIDSNVFSYGTKRDATLYVPAGTKAIYQSTSGWGDFANIVEMEPENKPYAVWCEGNTTLYFLTSTESLAEGGTYKGQTITKVWSGKDITESPFNSAPVWNSAVRNQVTEVVFDESFKDVLPVSTSGWFAFCNNLETIDGLSKLNTSSVTDMSGMFAGCENLLSVDVSGFNTNKVTALASMFYKCSTLNVLNLENFDTQNVTDMNRMFWGCTNLKKLTMSNFDTHNVTNFYCMFTNCSSLKSIDVSGFDTEKATNIRAMFAGCNSLESVNLSSFNTDGVSDLGLLFAECNTLKELDLSSFKTEKVEKVDSMFLNCKSLKTIYVSYGWSTKSVKTHKDMFENCSALVGGNGTKYDASYTNVTYACIDTEDAPGYLTAKTKMFITLSSDFQSYCSDKDLDFTGVEGLKAYIASGFNPESGEVLLSHVNLVPAKTGMLLIGTAGQSYEVPYAETDFIYSNLFRGLLEDVEVTSGYVLKGNEFVAVDGTETVKGGEAYLNVAPVANARRLTIRFTDTEVLPSGIESVLTDETGKADAWYTLQGTRMSNKPSKPGVYVHQGRKVVVK